jgi:hypothetical protein
MHALQLEPATYCQAEYGITVLFFTSGPFILRCLPFPLSPPHETGSGFGGVQNQPATSHRRIARRLAGDFGVRHRPILVANCPGKSLSPAFTPHYYSATGCLVFLADLQVMSDYSINHLDMSLPSCSQRDFLGLLFPGILSLVATIDTTSNTFQRITTVLLTTPIASLWAIPVR